MLEVERLLADCLHDARDTPLGTVPVAAGDPTYPAARRAFVAAGLRALREDLPECGWVQVNLAPVPGAWPSLYRQLGAAAREVTASGLAGDFFFMHKPPGLRARFRASRPDRAEALRTELLRLFERTDGAWARPWAAVYEPETYLFGGPRSMADVHALFTLDSLAWLDHHAGAAEEGSPLPADWRVSLALLRGVLDGLGIVGWEHRGVWEGVREAGRRFTEGLRGEARQRAAAGVRAYWELPRERQIDAFPEAWRTSLRAHQEAAFEAASRWRTGYFESGEAVIGPRRAAAYYVIFHWNRGRFALGRQCLLTEALAAPSAPAGGAAADEGTD